MISKNLLAKLGLVIIIAGLITGLIVVTMHSCNNNENYSSKASSNSLNNQFDRIGTDCQRTPCNKVDSSWLENATPEDIKNLTIEKDGSYYRCNRSCPPSIGLPITKNKLYLGVM